MELKKKRGSMMNGSDREMSPSWLKKNLQIAFLQEIHPPPKHAVVYKAFLQTELHDRHGSGLSETRIIWGNANEDNPL